MLRVNCIFGGFAAWNSLSESPSLTKKRLFTGLILCALAPSNAVDHAQKMQYQLKCVKYGRTKGQSLLMILSHWDIPIILSKISFIKFHTMKKLFFLMLFAFVTSFAFAQSVDTMAEPVKEAVEAATEAVDKAVEAVETATPAKKACSKSAAAGKTCSKSKTAAAGKTCSKSAAAGKTCSKSAAAGKTCSKTAAASGKACSKTAATTAGGAKKACCKSKAGTKTAGSSCSKSAGAVKTVEKVEDNVEDQNKVKMVKTVVEEEVIEEIKATPNN